MLNFLRKFRKKGIKSTRYLKYAIGEIILVVIGILIALSINNWNESQKVSNKERIHLQSLKTELETSLLELHFDIQEHRRNLESTLDVYEYIQNKPALVDSMYIDFYNMVRVNYFFPKTSTYETLKAGNLEVIRSDSLRDLITNIYESGYERIRRKTDTRRNAGRLLFPYYQKHFKTEIAFSGTRLNLRNLSRNKTIGIPNDYASLINDPEFKSLVIEAIQGRLVINRDFEKSIEFVDSCIKAIDSYLNR